MFKLFETKKFFCVDVNAKYNLLETIIRGMETEWRRLGEAARGAETVSRGLEGILRIRRLRRTCHGAHGGPALPRYS